MRHYCTLFDVNYLPQGLALYESLMRHSSEEFVLHVLAMDVVCEQVLRRLALPSIRIVDLAEFERAMKMERVRANRDWREYCWTCASVFMELVMRDSGSVFATCMWPEKMDSLTYIDADCFFFGDPKVVFDEIGKCSLGIIPHRFPPERKHMEINGLYNVSFVMARWDTVGKRCIYRWAEQCRDWCYYRNEDGRFGDQAYLDEWEMLYPGDCHIVRNHGVGLAPWNLSAYELIGRDDYIMVGRDLRQGQDSYATHFTNLIFYHYHEFKDLGDGTCRPTNYSLREYDKEIIYRPYIRAVMAAKERIASVS